MKPPLFVRPLTQEEHATLQQGLQSSDGFVLRRCQCLLRSAEGHTPAQIERMLGCTGQSVRNAIRAFGQEGLGCLIQKSHRRQTLTRLIPDDRLEALRDLMHQSPRAYGIPNSRWTLSSVAKVSVQQGLTDREVSQETIRQAIKRLKIGWKRAKRWINSPDPDYERKRGRETD